MEYFNTVAEEQLFEQSIQKSRFIGRVAPVSTEQEAQDFIDGVKWAHRDATHNCYAYYLYHDQIKRFNDDGEPGSTAGLPIFDILIRNNVYNCVIVVTRYFGGTLLGSGGLVRAYSSTAAGALSKARIVKIVKSWVMELTMDYSFLRTFQSVVKQIPQVKILDIEYTEKVYLKIACQSDFKQEIIERIINITSSQAEFSDEHIEFLPWE